MARVLGNLRVGTGGETEFVAGTTSLIALAENLKRKYLGVQNKGSVSVYLKFAAAHTGTGGTGELFIEVPANGFFEMINAPVDAVYIKSASVTPTVVLIEGVGA